MSNPTHSLSVGLEAATRERLLRFPKVTPHAVASPDSSTTRRLANQAIERGNYLTSWSLGADDSSAERKDPTLTLLKGLLPVRSAEIERRRLTGQAVFTPEEIVCNDERWAWDSPHRHLSHIGLSGEPAILELHFTRLDAQTNRRWQQRRHAPLILELPITNAALLREAAVLCQLLQGFRARSALRLHRERALHPAPIDELDPNSWNER